MGYFGTLEHTKVLGVGAGAAGTHRRPRARLTLSPGGDRLSGPTGTYVHKGVADWGGGTPPP